MTNKILIIGLGNPILSDDGAGWHAAREVVRQFRQQGRLAQLAQTQWPSGWIIYFDAKTSIEVDCLSAGGLGLMERLVGTQQAVILDAIASPDQLPGTVLKFPLQDLPAYGEGHSASVHDASLQQALEMGRSLGAELPESIHIVGIVTNPTFEFGENLSPLIAAAVSDAAADVLCWLDERLYSGRTDVQTGNYSELLEVKP